MDKRGRRTMHKDWNTIARDLTGLMSRLGTDSPDVGRAFAGLATAATKPGALDTKTKELIALAIGIAARCDGCIAFHARAAARHGASREEFLETIGMAVYMGGGPSMVYGAQALEAYDQFTKAA